VATKIITHPMGFLLCMGLSLAAFQQAEAQLSCSNLFSSEIKIVNILSDIGAGGQNVSQVELNSSGDRALTYASSGNSFAGPRSLLIDLSTGKNLIEELGVTFRGSFNRAGDLVLISQQIPSQSYALSKWQVLVLDASTGKVKYSLSPDIATSMFSKNGNLILSSPLSSSSQTEMQNTVSVNDAQTGIKLATFTRPLRQAKAIAASPDNRHVVVINAQQMWSNSSEGILFSIHDIKSGRTIIEESSPVYSAVYDPSGKYLLTGIRSKSIPGENAFQLRNGRTGEVIRTFGYGFGGAQLSFTKNGKQIIALGGTQVALFDLKTLAPTASIKTDTFFRSATASANGDLVIVSTPRKSDRETRAVDNFFVYEFATGKVVYQELGQAMSEVFGATTNDGSFYGIIPTDYRNTSVKILKFN